MINSYKILSELRNGYNAYKSTICVKPSKHTLNLLAIFKAYGLIKAISPVENKRVTVYLKYNKNTKALFSIGNLSKPSMPIYFSVKNSYQLFYI